MWCRSRIIRCFNETIKFERFCFHTRDSVFGITFNGVTTEIDTNFTGTVTTVVPTGLPTGLVELTVTKRNGTFAKVPFNVIGNYPLFTTAAPPKITVEKRAPYIVRVPNDWFNEYGTNGDNIQIDSFYTPSLYGLGGFEMLNGIQFAFYVSALDRTNKTIELTINRGIDPFGDSVNVLYEGNFTVAADTTLQRIIFFNEEAGKLWFVPHFRSANKKAN